jgi:hypothetical protein
MTLSFDDIRHDAEHIIASYGQRDDTAQAIENIYLMRDDIPVPPHEAEQTIVLTRSPDNRNAILMARRLLTSTEPIVNVPYDRNDGGLKDQADELEKYAQALLSCSNHYSQKPLHYNVSLSELLYSEAIIAINSTADMLAALGKDASPAQRARVERLAAATPYIFRALHPLACNPVWDDYGLCKFVYIRELTIEQILAQFKDARKVITSKADLDSTIAKKKVVEYWNLETKCCYIQGTDKPLYLIPHELPFIPFACNLGEGSDMFGSPEDQREPFLLTELRSGMGARKNLMYTAMFTQLREKGFVTPLVWSSPVEGAPRPAIKRDGLFQYIDAGTGTLTTLRHEMDPAFEMALNLAIRAGEESTMYKVAGGASLSPGSAFSTHAMLSQSAQIPLETIRNQSGRVIAEALRIAFLWLKNDSKGGGTYSVFDYGKKKKIDIDVARIDEQFDLNVKLDIALPQNMQQNAAVFGQLYGKVPTRVLYEELLKMGQYADAQQELWDEQMDQAYYAMEVQKMLQPPQPQLPAGAPTEPPASGLPVEQTEMGGMGPETPAFEQMPEEEGMGLA